MDKDLLKLELNLFGDWLCDKKDDTFDQTQIDDKLISEYLSERTEFAKVQKGKYKHLYADIIP